MVLDEVPCVVVRLESIEDVAQVLELSVVSALKVWLDRDTVFQVQGERENGIIYHEHVLDVAVGNDTEFLHADTFVRNTALSK